MMTTSPGCASAIEMRLPQGGLTGHGVRQADAELRVDVHDVTGAVEARAGVAPPKTYGVPMYCWATANTCARLKFGYGGLARKSETDGPV